MVNPENYLPKELGVCIVLIGMDVMGREVTAPADTTLVSAYGCIAKTRTPLTFSGEVTICWNESRAKGFLRPCKNWRELLPEPESVDSAPQYVIEFHELIPAFWETDLLVRHHNDPVAVECCNCKYSLETELDGIERMVYQSEGTFVRLCPCCGESRYFHAPNKSEVVEEQPGSDVNLVTTGEEIYHFKSRMERLNGRDERKFKRMATRNTKACVQCAGQPDDIVEVLDVSLGGLRFQSLHD